MKLQPFSLLALTSLTLTLAAATNTLTAQDIGKIQKGEMAGYLLVPNETVPETYNAGFSMYVAAWPLLAQYAGDLLSHELDFVQYLLGHGILDNCVCSGLNAPLHDDREGPDTWVATYEFAKLGRTVTFEGSMNATDNQPVTICGRDATLRFDAIAHNVSTFEIIPAGHNQKTGLPKGYERGKTAYQPNHVVDWVNCIRSRSTPKCSTDEAFIETATFLMSLVSQQERRIVRWDAGREEIV